MANLKRVFLVSVFLVLLVSLAYAEMPRRHNQSIATVTNAATYIMTASQVGRDILIQNNDASGIVYLNLSGVATASAGMFTLDPGESLFLTNVLNAVSAIGSVASNANVAISEGE